MNMLGIEFMQDGVSFKGYVCLGCGMDLSAWPVSAAAHICHFPLSERLRLEREEAEKLGAEG